MKRYSLIICLVFSTLALFAQPGHFPPGHSDGGIIRMQTREIAERLNLDSETESRFVKEYSAFRKEIDAVARKAFPPQSIDNESEIDKALQSNFEVSEQILKIRQKYYRRFKAFLKPSQIQMMYFVENEAGRRMIHDKNDFGCPSGREFPGSPDGPEGFDGPPPMPPMHPMPR